MNSIRKLLPGQPGTNKWLEKYGDRLLCVRYRYDEARRRKIKTIEIIVEDKPWDSNKTTREYHKTKSSIFGSNMARFHSANW